MGAPLQQKASLWGFLDNEVKDSTSPNDINSPSNSTDSNNFMMNPIDTANSTIQSNTGLLNHTQTSNLDNSQNLSRFSSLQPEFARGTNDKSKEPKVHLVSMMILMDSV